MDGGDDNINNQNIGDGGDGGGDGNLLRNPGVHPPVVFVNDRRVQEIVLDLKEGNTSLDTPFLSCKS